MRTNQGFFSAELSRGGESNREYLHGIKTVGIHMLRTGDQFDSFEIVDRLGSGATGCVYLGKNLTLGTQVAIKVLSQTTSQNQATATQRFKREAQLASQLDHPNIARALSFGIMDGQPFIVY